MPGLFSALKKMNKKGLRNAYSGHRGTYFRSSSGWRGGHNIINHYSTGGVTPSRTFLFFCPFDQLVDWSTLFTSVLFGFDADNFAWWEQDELDPTPSSYDHKHTRSSPHSCLASAALVKLIGFKPLLMSPNGRHKWSQPLLLPFFGVLRKPRLTCITSLFPTTSWRF